MTRSLDELEVGDRVQVFTSYRRGQPKDGYDGTVMKVGRVLIQVQYGGSTSWTPFRMDTGIINDNYGQVRIKTPEQVKEDNEYRDLSERLRKGGLREEAIGRSRLSAETLRAVVEVLERQET